MVLYCVCPPQPGCRVGAMVWGTQLNPMHGGVGVLPPLRACLVLWDPPHYTGRGHPLPQPRGRLQPATLWVGEGLGRDPGCLGDLGCHTPTVPQFPLQSKPKGRAQGTFPKT